MDTCIAGVVFLFLLTFACATPASEQEYGLCSQVYLMHQYCTSQTSSATTGVTPRPVAKPRIGKAGPRGLPGPPGIVNYTSIDEKIEAKYAELETRFGEKFADLERKFNEKIEKLQNETTKVEEIAGTKTENQEETSGTTIESCSDATRPNAKKWDGKGGIFQISRQGKTYEVFCDVITDEGGWTVFARRVDGSVDFFRTWGEYADGFGDKSGEFWLGLENIFQLTQDGAYELRVELTDWDGTTLYAKYGTFAISGRSDNYRLTVGEYSGTAGDSLDYHNGHEFSAKNKDVDPWGDHCALLIEGAWWYKTCAYSSLNGRYNGTARHESGLLWQSFKNKWSYSLKGSEMKFRKK